jgi:hypothetical protein
MTDRFIYKGWLGWCPIYLDADLKRPTIKARRFIPNFWLDINAVAMGLSGYDGSKIKFVSRRR